MNKQESPGSWCTRDNGRNRSCSSCKQWGCKTSEPSESKFIVNDVADSDTFENRDGTENDNYISLDLYSRHNKRRHIFYRHFFTPM